MKNGAIDFMPEPVDFSLLMTAVEFALPKTLKTAMSVSSVYPCLHGGSL